MNPEKTGATPDSDRDQVRRPVPTDLLGWCVGRCQRGRSAHPKFADKIVATARTAPLLAARRGPPRRPAPRHHHRPGVQGRQLHRTARARHRDHRQRVAGVALFTGMVEARAMEEDRSSGCHHDPGEIHRDTEQGILRRNRTRTPSSCRCGPGRPTTWHHPGVRRKARRSPCVPSPSRRSTCPQRPTSTFRWATHARIASGSGRSRSRPIPTLWGHPAGAGASPEDLAFIEQKLRAFLGTP